LCSNQLIGYPRIVEPKSRNTFFSEVNNAPLAVVQFYSRQLCDAKQKNVLSVYQCLKQRLYAVSQNSRFCYADITFILMDVSCDSLLCNDLCISTLPTMQLFVNGRPLLYGKGPIHIDGIVSEIDINQFIEDYLGMEIEQVTNARAAHDKDVEQAKLAAWAAWAPYWYCGYYRPVSCGWGWGLGGGCGWCW
jgi:hypothetical protein